MRLLRYLGAFAVFSFALAIYMIVEGRETLHSLAKMDDPPTPAGAGVVAKVVDGDTVWVDTGKVVEKVRVVGINSPESADPDRDVECWGPEASNAAERLLGGQSVKLATDPTQDARDKYDRLLAYVRITTGPNAGRDFGALMVAQGNAYEYTYDEDYQRQQRYRDLQAKADQNDRGLWKDCD